MTDLETMEIIHAHLDEHPDDWVARLQLADLLESEGQDDEASYQRWAVQHKKAPLYTPHSYTYSNAWHWFVKHREASRDASGDNVYLQASLGDMARSMDEYGYFKGYVSRMDAEHSLLKKLMWCGWPAPEPK